MKSDFVDIPRGPVAVLNLEGIMLPHPHFSVPKYFKYSHTIEECKSEIENFRTSSIIFRFLVFMVTDAN